MMLPGQIKRNRFVVLKDGRKMFIDDVDYKGNNNPFGHWAIHVVSERGATDGEWVTGEQVVRVVSDPIQRPDVIDMGPLTYNRPTKQKTLNEEISVGEAQKLCKAKYGKLPSMGHESLVKEEPSESGTTKIYLAHEANGFRVHSTFLRKPTMNEKRLSRYETKKLITKLVKLNEDTQVANTILQQMGGGGRLRMMLGVKQFTAYPNGVGFAWPNPRRAQGGNYVKITLQPSDTYKMEFLNVSRGGAKPVKSYDNVYFDQLIELFEKQTGWYLRLREAIELDVPTKPQYPAALQRFLDLLTQREAAHKKKNFPTLRPTTFSVDPGRQYDRIVASGETGRSVYCFIRKADGAILKAAGWKAPAKHPRGSIFASDPLAGTGVYGADYLRAEVASFKPKTIEAALDPQARSTKPVRFTTCKLCSGTGNYNGQKCGHCDGKGSHPELRKDVDEMAVDPAKARGRWMPTKVTKPPKKGKGTPYNRQQFKKGVNESDQSVFEPIFQKFDAKDYWDKAGYRKSLAGRGSENEIKWFVNHKIHDDALKMFQQLVAAIERKDKQWLIAHVRPNQPFMTAIYKAVSGKNPGTNSASYAKSFGEL